MSYGCVPTVVKCRRTCRPDDAESATAGACCASVACAIATTHTGLNGAGSGRAATRKGGNAGSERARRERYGWSPVDRKCATPGSSWGNSCGNATDAVDDSVQVCRSKLSTAAADEYVSSTSAG